MAMETLVFKNISILAYTNEADLNDFHGIVVNFHGLNRGLEMRNEPDPLGRICTENGLLYLFPYLDPWSWMNDASIEYVDRLLDAVFERYRLPDGFPLCVAGRSMGGQCALVYAARGRYRAASCALNCPVCDMAYHFSEREDVPRTMLSAFLSPRESFEAALGRADPRRLTGRLPDIAYFFAHCGEDTKVNKAHHSDMLVKALRALGRSVRYLEVAGRDHIQLTESAYAELFGFIVDSLRARAQ